MEELAETFCGRGSTEEAEEYQCPKSQGEKLTLGSIKARQYSNHPNRSLVSSSKTAPIVAVTESSTKGDKVRRQIGPARAKTWRKMTSCPDDWSHCTAHPRQKAVAVVTIRVVEHTLMNAASKFPCLIRAAVASRSDATN